jgi:hypothetical protein
MTDSFSLFPSRLAISCALLALFNDARNVIICLRVGAGLARLFAFFDRLLEAMQNMQ